MFSDFSFILYWWILIFGVGIVFLPLSFVLFKNFWDKGYVFSKILGILLVSYIVWLLGSLKILPFLNETIWLVVIAGFIFNYYFLIKYQTSNLAVFNWDSTRGGGKSHNQISKIKSIFKNNWRIFVLEEGLFFIALVFWSFVRGFQPDIHGLEKFMDYGFVNSILRSRYFPPADMWLAGETINYYYFGHLVSAVLTKLSGIDSAITYNLMIATLFALTFVASFSLGSNLIFIGKQEKLSRLALDIRYSLKIKNLKLEIFGGVLTAFLVTSGGNLHPLWWFLKHGNYQSYWYPDATRFIVQQFGAQDNTIHEFPIYSFVVADLHGHLLNLPNVLLFLALVLVIFNQKISHLFLYFFISLFLGVFYMTNAWDFATYNLVFGVLILLFNYLKYKKNYLETIFGTAKIVFPVFLGSIILTLPFHLNFKSLVGGLALADFHSPFWMLLVLWGFPLFLTISFLICLIKKMQINKLQTNDFFVSVLLGVSWFLIIFPEFFYIKDIYIHTYQRANTMFKLTYQSFVMFYLAAFYIIFNFLKYFKIKILKFFWLIFVFSFLFFILVIYPNYAIKSYYGLKIYRGLYGLEFLNKLYPDDYRAILWLKKSISGQPVIVEAVGESYTDFARVSANTGLPTILGWRVHEWLWRGSFDEAGKRTGEVQEIYELSDLERTKILLKKYNVSYVFLGTLEKQQYKNLQEDKFNKLGEIVFTSGETKIYKIK
jgi:uncharacterized membrane protein